MTGDITRAVQSPDTPPAEVFIGTPEGEWTAIGTAAGFEFARSEEEPGGR